MEKFGNNPVFEIAKTNMEKAECAVGDMLDGFFDDKPFDNKDKE